jgi:hypothetical protein
MATREEIPQTDPAEIETLIERLRQSNLEPQVIDKINRILQATTMRNSSPSKLAKMLAMDGVFFRKFQINAVALQFCADINGLHHLASCSNSFEVKITEPSTRRQRTKRFL